MTNTTSITLPTCASLANKSLRQWLNVEPEQFASSVSYQLMDWPLASAHGVDVFARRDDLLDVAWGGNKVYKLYGHLQEYLQRQCVLPLASFGGAYSNLLLALAAAGKALNVPTVGIIRGQRPTREGPTLRDLRNLGMRLHFVSREDYRRRYDSAYWRYLDGLLGANYWIEEGGGGELSRRGCRALGASLAAFDTDWVFQACGTAATFAGIIAGAALHVSRIQADLVGPRNIPRFVGISALKAGSSQWREVLKLTADVDLQPIQWRLSNQYHHGGFAKLPAELFVFMQQFEAATGVPLEQVYTGKVVWAIAQMIRSGVIAKGQRVVFVHSGGLQGRRSLAE